MELGAGVVAQLRRLEAFEVGRVNVSHIEEAHEPDARVRRELILGGSEDEAVAAYDDVGVARPDAADGEAAHVVLGTEEQTFEARQPVGHGRAERPDSFDAAGEHEHVPAASTEAHELCELSTRVGGFDVSGHELDT